MTSLFPITAEHVNDVWGFAGPLVERGLNKVKEYRWKAEDILFYLQERDMQLWLVADDNKTYGIVITQILITPQARECFLFMMSGHLPGDWRKIFDELEQWARDMQCTHISAMSRPGSAKLTGLDKGLVHTFRRL